MKLLNRTLLWFSGPLLIIVALWAILFYVNMMDEIYDSIDDGLRNYKMLIINKSSTDTTLLQKQEFGEGNYALTPIPEDQALTFKDTYTDTLMYMQYEDDLEPVRMLTTAFRHETGYYRLQVISSMVEEDDLMEDLFWSIVWLYIILVISILIINNLILQRLWKPFYQLLEHLKNFRLDKNQKLPVAKTRTKEFMELHKASNILIEHALETFNRQKEFTENASHELQTPLAVITNKLELLLESDGLQESEAEKVGEILGITGRMTQLNKSLLLLSKIENKQFFNNQTISLNQAIDEAVGELTDFASYKEVRIHVNAPARVDIEMDATLLKILLSNLLNNALFHNKTGGEIKISIEENKLEIKNTPIDGPLDEATIYNRFYKDSANRHSSGLGLPIVRAVCELYHFQLRYHFDGMHTFQITGIGAYY